LNKQKGTKKDNILEELKKIDAIYAIDIIEMKAFIQLIDVTNRVVKTFINPSHQSIHHINLLYQSFYINKGWTRSEINYFSCPNFLKDFNNNKNIFKPYFLSNNIQTHTTKTNVSNHRLEILSHNKIFNDDHHSHVEDNHDILKRIENDK
jgi:hypothetical protein